MKHVEKDRAGGLRMPRSRGAVSGLLLVILGAWGALIPFVGPYFNFAYTPDHDWAWNSARGWLEVFPGVTTVLGGLLLIGSRNRASAMFGGWLAVLGGAWFVVGGEFAPMLRIGSVGDPVAATDRKRALLEVSYFSGLGALIVFVGGVVLARLTVRLARDVAPQHLQQPVDPPPYVSAADAATPETAPDALTTPREEPSVPAEGEQPAKGFHRQRAGAAAGSPDANYLHWPHPQ